MTDGRITARELRQVIDLAQEMLLADVQLLEHVQPTLARLSESHSLMLITKGDLRDQESKFSRSGLAHYFRYIEIVSDKTRETYAAILAKYQIEPSRFLMVGNSLRSDIVPVLALGGQAIYVPYHITWAHEAVAHGEDGPRGYLELEHLGLLPEVVERLDAAAEIG
jgi:putative hydrolase of the HAD superfamily